MLVIPLLVTVFFGYVVPFVGCIGRLAHFLFARVLSVQQLMAVHVPLTAETVHEHAVIASGGVEMQLRSFLSSTLDDGEQSVSRPGRFTLWKEPHVRIVPIE